ncbi:helix-turn-helix domain-containing protein [Streptomyces sp. SID13031]|uniref:helix-turn-helix domain-containing protein n=1 Tax=Streptomyces sp. SID13031 TaxID=2706046 RepID=UPI0013CAE19C|nr:helix-turn-helix domain-containing protein [Streptomyces sp. SID13031]
MSRVEPGVALFELRKRLGRSQAEVATAIGTTQSGVSRIERQPDLRVSTLGEYVAALGGHLRLVVEHEKGSFDIVVPALGKRRPVERREYRVIWQDSGSRSLVHIGWLEYKGDEFVFSYTDDAKFSTAFEPFPPFPLFDETYRSVDLFPFFAVRLTSAADPGFDAVIDALGLSRDQATPAEILARASPDSGYDTIQVIPEPTELPDGTLVRRFLASGVRHVDEQRPERVSEAISNLTPGARLDLVPEPTNPANPRAIQLVAGQTLVGWVPNYLVEEIQGYLERRRIMSVSVDRANGSDTPWHLRLLCQLEVRPVASASGFDQQLE